MTDTMATMPDHLPAPSDADAPRSVLLEVLPLLDGLHGGIVEALRRRAGTKFQLMLTQGDAPGFVRHVADGDAVIDTTALQQRAESDAATHDETSTYARAREIETRYNITYMRDIIQLDRRISTSFNPAASASVHASHDEGSLAKLFGQINFYIGYFETLLSQQQIDLVIVRPDSRAGAAVTYVAAARGIPVTLVGGANYGSLVTWMCGPFMAPGFVMSRMRQAAPAPAQISADDSADDAADDSKVPAQARAFMRERLHRLPQASYLLNQIYRATKIRIAHLLLDVKNRRWGRRRRIAYTAVIKQHWRVYRNARYLTRHSESSLQTLTARPFVLFLLQVEPEYSTLCLAREFGHTEAIVHQLALSMPAGVNLVVKEHAPNIGNRPLESYARFRRLPNVLLADYRLPGHELAEAATAVATISGSIGKQSTRMGKPAIVFSGHVDYAQMPNVRVVRSLHDLPEILRWATQSFSDAEIAQWRQAGDSLYDALAGISFDGAGLRLLGGDGSALPQEQIELAVDRLLDMVRWQRQFGVPL
ncbi:MAG: hypothetical protein ACTSX7_02890 [Alphaproteobacteria bacterium]